MPVARIVTSTPEQVSAAADHLRASGYTVQIVAPEAVPGDAAELEIDAVDRTPEEALSQAVQATQRPRRVIAYDLTGRPVEFAYDEEQSVATVTLWQRVTAGAREVGENMRLSVDHLREWVQEGRDAVAQKQAERATRRVEQQSAARLALQRAQEEEAERARQHQEDDARAAAVREQHARAEAEQRAQWALAERERQQILEHERAARREADERRQREVHAQQQRLAEEQRQREQERAAEEARVARERQLRETEDQRRATLQERLARIAAEREQSARKPEEAPRNIAPAEVAVQGVPVPPHGQFRREKDLRKAMVAAAVVALLATMGYAAYEGRQPASPLSNRDLVRSQAISQPVPFGAATVTPPAPAMNPHPTLPQSSVAPPPSLNPKPSPGISSRPQMKRQSHRRADDAIADDEVVIHHASTPAPPRPASGSGTKHYSDLQQ